MTALASPVTDSLFDEALMYYHDWLDDAATVTDAYDHWCESPADEEAGRYAVYCAALDQEQAAARAYAASIAELERWLPSARRALR